MKNLDLDLHLTDYKKMLAWLSADTAYQISKFHLDNEAIKRWGMPATLTDADEPIDPKKTEANQNS